MPCSKICDKGLKRFHTTCFTCRKRKWFYNKLNKQDFFRASLAITVKPDPNGIVIPKNGRIFFVFVNPKRRFQKIKSPLLATLGTIIEMLA